MKSFYDELEKDLKDKFGKDIRIWVWPEYNDVKGFFGDGVVKDKVVIWITERPSSARNTTKIHKFPDWIDKSFYKVLREEGFGNMHFTDFVKIMEKAGAYPNEEELKVSALWMEKEIERLKQKDKKLVIVANSKNVVNWMNLYLPKYPFRYVKFFKSIVRYSKKKEREENLKEILNKL